MQAVLVHKRERPRNTIFHMDSFLGGSPNSNYESSILSTHCSVESLNSPSHSSGKRQSTRDQNYNVRIFKDLKQSGHRPLPQDVRDARRECQTAYDGAVNTEEKKQTIYEASEQLNQLALFLAPNSDECNTQFVAEYQAFVCWVYTKIRFGNFAINIAKHFSQLKNRHKQIFECLKSKKLRVERLSAMLRFSQLCLEYAEVCDADSLQWCRRALDEAEECRKRSGSRLSDNQDGLRTKREREERREKEERSISLIRELLHSNITQIELAWTLGENVESRPKNEVLV